MCCRNVAAYPLLTNTGHTPAQHLKWRIQADVLPLPLQRNFKFPLPAHNEGSALLPPQQSFEIGAVVGAYVSDADVPVIKRGDGWALFVWGYLTYEDIFGHQHRTTFAQQYAWVPGSTNQNWEVPETAHVTYLGKHNRAN